MEDVFAAGDVVEFPLRLAARRRKETVAISHWQMALKMGQVAAKNMFIKSAGIDDDNANNESASSSARLGAASSQGTRASREGKKRVVGAVKFIFFSASSHFYKRSCPLVGRLVGNAFV